MLVFHKAWAEWVEFCLPLFINHCWQASLFFIVVVIINYKLKQWPARIRYIIWLTASLKFIFPSVLFTLLAKQISNLFSNKQNHISLPTNSFIHLVVEPLSANDTNTLLTRHNEIYCAIAIVWLVISLILLLVWCKNIIFSLRAITSESVALNKREALIFEQAKRELSIKQKVQLIVSKNISEVGVLGIWKPIIVLPENIAEQMSDAELDSIFRHELIHIKRFDNLINSIHRIICCLFWFNPIVWIIEKNLLIERELSCDEAVLESGNLSKDYASGLLKAFKFCLGWKNAHFSHALSSNLQRRIEKIMNNNSNTIKKRHKLLVSSMTLTLIMVSAIIGISNQNNVSALPNSNSVLGNNRLLLDDDDKEKLPENGRKDYEHWKQNILPTIGKKNSDQAHIYISATVQRLNEETGEIKLAIAQQSTIFRIEIQPLETEKTADGNMFVKETGKKATVSVNKSGISTTEPKMNYSEPSITFLVEARTNAVEVVLYGSTTKTVSKLVLPFTNTPSNGLLTSVAN